MILGRFEKVLCVCGDSRGPAKGFPGDFCGFWKVRESLGGFQISFLSFEDVQNAAKSFYLGASLERLNALSGNFSSLAG